MLDGLWESSRPCNAQCWDSSTGFPCLSAARLQSPTHQESLLLGGLMIHWAFLSDQIVHLQTGWWESCHTIVTGAWCECNGKKCSLPVEISQHSTSAALQDCAIPAASQPGWHHSQETLLGKLLAESESRTEGFSDMQELGLRERLTIFWAASWHSYLLQFNCCVTAVSWKKCASILKQIRNKGFS